VAPAAGGSAQAATCGAKCHAARGGAAPASPSPPPPAPPPSRLCSPTADWAAGLRFTAYLQWHAHLQLSDAAHAARRLGVLLKGDLPIGVDRRSVDCWLSPQLFRLATSSGAPPDAFDGNGQNWGFPTYNWPELARTRHAWWRRRLHRMALYFSALRVDHVLGFFRIWELPDQALGGAPPSQPHASALFN
jgi:4-alpha-glucanotransferase